MDSENKLNQLNKIIKEKKYVDFTNSQRLGKFLKNIKAALKIVEGDKESDIKIKVTRVRIVEKKSIAPGTILIFNYYDEQGVESIRKILTVNCSRTKGGTWFPSTKDNDLLSAYDLNDVDAELLSEIMDKLYKNKQACTYQYNPTDLIEIVPTLEPTDFRTYNLKHMTSVNTLNIVKRA